MFNLMFLLFFLMIIIIVIFLLLCWLCFLHLSIAITTFTVWGEKNLLCRVKALTWVLSLRQGDTWILPYISWVFMSFTHPKYEVNIIMILMNLTLVVLDHEV
jgi:hypothetical protein